MFFGKKKESTINREALELYIAKHLIVDDTDSLVCEENSSEVVSKCYSSSDKRTKMHFFEAIPCAKMSAKESVMEEYSFPEENLKERLSHLSDTFSEYLLYLIESKNMTNSEVYKRALVDKKTFSKIKNNPDYHPQKMTALCLCIGAKLNLDEAKDLLQRAGYALSPSDITDVIFSFFIENQIYDMIELDIQLEEHGAQCLIS